MIITFDNFTIAPIKDTDAWKVCDFMVINEERLKAYFPKTLEPTTSNIPVAFCCFLAG